MRSVSDAALRRVFDLLARGDMGGAREEPSAMGRAVFDDELDLRHDSNYLLVDALQPTTPASDVLAEAARLRRRAVFVPDQRTGAVLAPGFSAAGWQVHRGAVMRCTAAPRPTANTSPVHLVDESDLRPARRELLAGQPWATPEVVEQLLEAKVRIMRRVRARFFAYRRDGRVVSCTDLYDDGATAQVEDVGTLERYRRRGYASLVVTAAAESAFSTGCDLVFLVTDAEGPARRLYSRLGFEVLGGYIKFLRPAADQHGAESARFRG